MNLYPYTFTVTKNLATGIMPMADTNVYVYINETGDKKSLFSDKTMNYGTELTQPLKTSSEGVVNFYCGPGRIRIDVQLDSTTISSVEDVIGDFDSIITPIIGESPVGQQNSNNTIFTLNSPIYGNKVSVYVNGLRIKRIQNTLTPSSGEFHSSENVLTFGTPPALTDTILVDYYPVLSNI